MERVEVIRERPFNIHEVPSLSRKFESFIYNYGVKGTGKMTLRRVKAFLIDNKMSHYTLVDVFRFALQQFVERNLQDGWPYWKTKRPRISVLYSFDTKPLIPVYITAIEDIGDRLSILDEPYRYLLGDVFRVYLRYLNDVEYGAMEIIRRVKA
jgi:hypothetical protein